MKRQRPRMTYEFRKVSFSKDVPRSVSLQELNDQAEYGRRRSPHSVAAPEDHAADHEQLMV